MTARLIHFLRVGTTTLAALILLSSWPTQGAAQDVRRSSLILEASPIRGTLGYTRGDPSSWNFGVQVGLGAPQIDVTLNSADGDFEDFFHVAPILRRTTERTLVEFGLRGGIGTFRECDSSGCWFGGYIAPSVLVAYGTERWKIGPRLTAGRIWEPGLDGSNFASISPINVLVSWRW